MYMVHMARLCRYNVYGWIRQYIVVTKHMVTYGKMTLSQGTLYMYMVAYDKTVLIVTRYRVAYGKTVLTVTKYMVAHGKTVLTVQRYMVVHAYGQQSQRTLIT